MLTLFSKKNCHLCDEAKKELQSIEGVTFQEIDIYENDTLVELYGLMIPVVVYEDKIIQYGIIKRVTIEYFLNNIFKESDTNHG